MIPKIIEKYAKSSQDEYGRAITLYPRSSEMLDQLGLADSLAEADVLLVGPHLESQFDELRQRAVHVGVAASLLPHDVFGAHGADAVLDTLPVLLAARAVVAGAEGDASLRPIAPGAEPDAGHH